MTEQEKPIDSLIYDLRERAKELNCLYQVQELLNQQELSIDEISRGIVNVIPHGWQYPDVCQAEINISDKIFSTPGYQETPWGLVSEIILQEETIGYIRVSYIEERPMEDEGPFLKEERKLIDTIAEQLGLHILHQQLKEVFQEQLQQEETKKSEWWVILDLLKRTDPKLLVRISRKMINYLYRKGIKDTDELLKQLNPAPHDGINLYTDSNQPTKSQESDTISFLSDKVFLVASQNLLEEEILGNIQKWIKEDRSGFLVDTLVNPASSLEKISSAIERYHHLASQGLELSVPRENWFRIALIRRILSDQPDYIETAKDFISVDDFSGFLQRAIFPSDSHGKLGGKSSGLFLAAHILKKLSPAQPLLKDVLTPRTWYLTSDGVFYFMSYNNLEDIIEQKYKDIGEIRQEYPYIVNIFKNSSLPPEIVKGLSLALDDFGDVPLIVRSSSLLEDRTGTAFAGKYKSLFIPNKGSKENRLASLIDAITEVYASMFGPDPIEYRYERGLVNHHEEMGILIQEVVGNRTGKYYFPAFAGVLFSHNEFRWSSRIRREDGLIRIVPGLGTRAVDRLSNDYPVLISPGKPNMRVNVSIDEILRYSPKYLDVINLESGGFESIPVEELILEYGNEIPYLQKLVSIWGDGHIQPFRRYDPEVNPSQYVVTFDELISQTIFVSQAQLILHLLENTLGHPVDIEFAHDGKNFYLLQCRAQSSIEESTPIKIPDSINQNKILFTANKYITNGFVTDISHIVYVKPEAYSRIENSQDMHSIGRAIGQLNQLLPRRKFILIGPGRWGSRGDIRLGVNVTYSDINNTAVLIEVAKKQGDYLPDPSFGTHFFQDLIESAIRYLPLYPDDPAVVFNNSFFVESNNIFSSLMPEMAHLSQVISVIEIQKEYPGLSLKILMNSDLDRAIAYLDAD